MDQSERLHLQKMINANNVTDYTADIREKKHSLKIQADVMRLLDLKRRYATVATNKPELFDEMCVSQCNFIFSHYTDIFNKVKKDEMNLEILAELLTVLKQIEDGEFDQHTGAFQVGKLLKKMYIDSALLKADKIDKETAAGAGALLVEKPPIKAVSWKEYKTMLLTPII